MNEQRNCPGVRMLDMRVTSSFAACRICGPLRQLFFAGCGARWCTGSVVTGGNVWWVSELLPNLKSLIAELSDEMPAVRDAYALAQAARGATTDDELDVALAAVVASWRRC